MNLCGTINLLWISASEHYHIKTEDPGAIISPLESQFGRLKGVCGAMNADFIRTQVPLCVGFGTEWVSKAVEVIKTACAHACVCVF